MMRIAPMAGAAAVVAAFVAASLTLVAAPGAQTPAPSSDASASGTPDAGRHAVAELPAEVTVSVRSSPRAEVRWGGKTLGETPLTLRRPRESGPMDLTLMAAGFLPLHVRAYTFNDDVINARLVRVADQHTVFGYPTSLDAGVPEAPPSADAPPTPDAPPTAEP
jgi:hypothetical protein